MRNREQVLLHQDAFAADKQEDEYSLSAWRSNMQVWVGKRCAWSG